MGKNLFVKSYFLVIGFLAAAFFCVEASASAQAFMDKGRVNFYGLATIEQQRVIAYHECGHALIAMVVPEAQVRLKNIVIDRNGEFPSTEVENLESGCLLSASETTKHLFAQLVFTLGGCVAQGMKIKGIEADKNITVAGFESDREQAKVLIADIVSALCEHQGSLVIDGKKLSVCCQRDGTYQMQYGSTIYSCCDRQKITDTVSQEAMVLTQKILSDHQDCLRTMVEPLLEKGHMNRCDVLSCLCVCKESDVIKKSYF
jgi:ATP-dependent Zn protease